MPIGTLWRLLKLPCSITEAGRQWAEQIEAWLIGDYNFDLVAGMDQLYIHCIGEGKVVLLAAKVTDDIFVAGSLKEITDFSTSISKRFAIRNDIFDDCISFNGFEIHQDSSDNITT